MTQWNIGCSGFHYKHWKGTFYPEDLPQRKWFDFYCQHFNTLELNVTFYRFPRLPDLRSWFDRAPDSFRFAVKAPRGITHYRKFLHTEKLISDFYSLVTEGLGHKLGCYLFQMPPNFIYSEERLQRVISGLDHSLPNVVEFRHESWWKEEVYLELGKNNISFCGMSHPSLPDEVVLNLPLLYYRFHGVGQLYASNYTGGQLKDFARKFKAVKQSKQAFIYFNNDIHTYAVTNAKKLISLL